MQLKKVIRKHKSRNLNKRGSMLTENIIFIILNLIFLTVLIVFLLRQGSGIVVLEQSYAKQLALLIDSSQPGMLIELDMTKAIEVAANNGLEARDIIEINENIVKVKLSTKSGYEYAFFNDVSVSKPYYYLISDKSGERLRLIISDKETPPINDNSVENQEVQNTNNNGIENE